MILYSYYYLYNDNIADMSRGGLQKNNKSHLNHLFKNKWRLGKTTAIRIPEVLKDFLMSLAKQLDKSELMLIDNNEIIKQITNYKNLESNVNLYRSEVLKLKKENDELILQIQNQNKQNNQKNNYQIAVECFEEFVKNQDLNFEDLSKARRGTKKHQLWQIKNWFESKQKS